MNIFRKVVTEYYDSQMFTHHVPINKSLSKDPLALLRVWQCLFKHLVTFETSYA